MPRSDDYKLGYSRGYNTGSSGRWPDHRPLRPPDPIVSELVRTAQNMRDGIDSILATMLEDDPMVEELGPLIDDFDDAMIELGNWIRSDKKLSSHL